MISNKIIYSLIFFLVISLTSLLIFFGITSGIIYEKFFLQSKPLNRISKSTEFKDIIHEGFIFDRTHTHGLPTQIISPEKLKQEKLTKINPDLFKGKIPFNYYGELKEDFSTKIQSPKKFFNPIGRKLFSNSLFLTSTTENSLTKPLLFPLGNLQNDVQRHYALYYLFRSLNKWSSKFIVYPYNFTYFQPGINNTKIKHEYPEGAIISLNKNVGSGFKVLATETNIKFGKAKALYDNHLAVLKIEGTYEGKLQDLTYESDYFCEVFGTYLGKYVQCLSGKDFEQYYLESDTPQFVFLNEKYIKKNILMIENSTTPRFHTLIIPDIILGSEELIIKTLGEDGINKIKEFQQAGGLIYCSGKGGALMEYEHFGLIPKGTYNKNFVLYSKSTLSDTTGCEEASNLNPYNAKGDENSYNEYIRSMLCFSLYKNKEKKQETYILAPYMMTSTGGMNTISKFLWNENLEKKDPRKGLGVPLEESEKLSLYQLLYKSVGKGHLIINNANPSFKQQYFQWLLNPILFAVSKNFILNSRIAFEGEEGKPIPGLEEGVVLDMELTYFNLFDTPLNDFSIYFWLPNKVQVMEINSPKECIVDDKYPKPNHPRKTLNETYYYICQSKTPIQAFESGTILIKVEITDATVTNAGWDILMLYPIVEYIDGKTGKFEHFKPGGLFVNAQMAALLRVSINPDPSSFYPIHGRGDYVDNVVPVENKERTSAYDVEFVAVAPIISPVVDGDDQLAPIRTITFWDKYYKKDINGFSNYPFPLRNLRDFDILDYNFLKGKDSILVSDWDTAVKNFKISQNFSWPSAFEFSNISIDLIKNINITTTNDNSNILTMQVHFADSDKFYEHATQRQLVFLDTTKESGAKNYYPHGIPIDKKNPNILDKQVTKKEYMWVRGDIYFYDVGEYTHPHNVNYTSVFSIDRFKKVYDGECIKEFGDARAKILEKGYFDDTKEFGLKANEYSNELLMHCERKKIKYEDIESFSGGSVKKTRYLVPIIDKEVKHATDIMHFNENDDTLIDYPEVRFVYIYSADLILTPDTSRKGGCIEIQFPSNIKFKSGKDPIIDSLVTYSADHVAFFKTEYNLETNTIKSYFRRGNMPNEQYGKPSQISVNFESLDTNKEEFNATKIQLWELKYDLSLKETNYERYLPRETFLLHPIKRLPFFSLPAIEMRFKLKRGLNSDGTPNTKLNPYEYLEPFARFGVYYQELLGHRTIWGSAEAHHVSDPGLTAINAGFSVISNIGISSIAFKEYLTVGKSQMIPSASQTSRVEWKDLWGRLWVQPLRSVFPDVPPIPPPLRNFMITTTYEITDPKTGERYLNWYSDEPVDVRVHIKLLNNYPKYFQITTCKENEYYRFVKDGVPDRLFEYYPIKKSLSGNDLLHNDTYIRHGNLAFYGGCFNTTEAYVSSKKVTSEQAKIISKAYLCAANLLNSVNCSDELQKLPTVSRRSTEDTKNIWNFSPLVEKYYPKDYIKDNMWDLTHYDYDDNAFDKAYKYHMDNNLPGMDKGIIKPHNIIAQPIWKGFGYQMSYDKSYSVVRYPQFKGWWSDNLQNKDNTVLAGQENSNDVSVDKDYDSLIKNENWIDISLLKNTTNNKGVDIAKNKLKNIYICEFNRHRIRMNPNSKRMYHIDNVYQNNIVPILPDLNSNDQRLTNYQCNLNKQQYTHETISQANNLLVTNSARDWLYFAANLRGGSRETINVVYKLEPFSYVSYEGDTKVNDGGRFVYWNPANGPNSFLEVDSQVNVLQALRSDVQIEVELFPKSTTTFQANVYHLISITDSAEILRRYTFPIYIDHYGFGDSSVSVYVGGTKGSSSILQPGQTTYAKITFYNNAGFDWNMKGDAIKFNYTGDRAISANDLLTRYKHAILVPLEYRFLIPEIDEEIKPYIHLEPSDHNVDVAPLFFDFQNINVVTIRDGYKGDYFYKITLNESFPQELRGKLLEIKFKINETLFDSLPGYNDPTKEGFHDYHLKVPPIKIGVPYSSSKGYPYSGNVYYTSGYSSNLKYYHKLPNVWKTHEAKFINKDRIMELRRIASDKENIVKRMQNFFDTLGNNTVQYKKYSLSSSSEEELEFDFKENFPEFPKKNKNNPDQAEFYILLKTTSDQLPYSSEFEAATNPFLKYNDVKNKERISRITDPPHRTVATKGAWLGVEYDGTIVDSESYEKLHDQRFFPEDNGIVEVLVKTINTGSDVAFNVNFTFFLASGVEILTEKLNYPYQIFPSKNVTKEGNKVVIYTGLELAPHIAHAELVYLRFDSSTQLQQQVQKLKKMKLLMNDNPPIATRKFINNVGASIDLTRTKGEVTAEQLTNKEFKVQYLLRERDRISLYGKQTIDKNDLPIINLEANPIPDHTPSGKPLRFIWYKRVKSPLIYSSSSNNNTIIEWEIISITNEKKIIDKTIPPRESNFTTWLVDYKVESIDENNEFLAESITLKFQYKYPVYYYWLIPLLFIPLVCIILLVTFIFVNWKLKKKEETNHFEMTGELPPGVLNVSIGKNSNRKWVAEHELKGEKKSSTGLITWLRADEIEINEKDEYTIEMQPQKEFDF